MLRKLFQIGLVPLAAVLAFVLLSCGATGRVVAQETFAPLITDNCIGFVHIDLRKVEPDQIKSVIMQTGEKYLKDLKFDDKSFKATMRELTNELNKVDRIVRPHFELIADKLGIRELAIIIDSGLEEDEQPMILVAVPWKNKTEKDMKTLEELLAYPAELDGVVHFAKGDFVFFTTFDEDDATKWVKNAVPSKKSVIHNVLKEAGEDEIKIAVAFTDRLKAEIKKIPEGEMPAQVKNVIQFSLRKIEWLSASVSLGQIIGNSKKMNCKMTIKTPKESDAVFLRNLIESSIDQGIFFGRAVAAAKMAQNEIPQNIPMGLILEYSRGVLRLLLPTVEGDRLVLSHEIESTSLVTEISYFGLLTSLTLPAVQAARSAARLMQSANKIRVIIIALHNYHDVHNEFPPLYTVDANGKPLHSWRVLILPYMGQVALYNSIKLDEPWDSEHNKQFHTTRIDMYTANTTGGATPDKKCFYAVIEGQPLKPKVGTKFAEITDGSSNTISVVVTNKPFCWMDPLANVTLEDLDKGFGRPDSVIGGNPEDRANIGFWDGSVIRIEKTIPPDLLRKLGTKDDGAAVDISPYRR
ncbi:MAG: DUF1559 domain-containing protein [Planctomycetaceae bacterium]|jgi:prepilin-type processing-associated H-X9-DG protein|nr:DUF1559 domain-containing protein [Planctomycetaceae bacterium]